MKIFSAAQIKACDAYTIHASGISTTDLMETAAKACYEWIVSHFTKEHLFVVLCGTGNNGGDGLALARMLHQAGFGVKAFQLLVSDDLSPDCSTNLGKLRQADASLITMVQRNTYITDIPADIILIDAIFGTGLNRPLDEWTSAFVTHINQLPNIKIAIDMPTGIPADTADVASSTILRADHTLSFQFYKRSFLHPETGRYTGEVHLLDIGLNPTFIAATHTNYQITDAIIAKSIWKKREPFSHKGTFGTATLTGGCHGMMGAVSLSAGAALRAGAGKVHVVAPACGYQIIQTLIPEALCTTAGDTFINNLESIVDHGAIGIGPGMGTHQDTADALEQFLDIYKQPLVLDADALNIIAGKKDLLHKLPAGTILTPHPKEFERIFGKTMNSFLQLEQARTQAMRYNIIIVLKGRFTTVVTPEGTCWYNSTGNTGLAKGGSGDVLTGIITSLLAQHYDPAEAAILGVYLHGLAADKALEQQSIESMTARDVIEHLGKAFTAVSY